MLFFSSRGRHTRCALVTGVQTCALPILYDVGVVELAGLAQRRDHAGNEVIDRLQHGEAAAVDLVDGGELPELEALQFVDQRRLVADVGFVEGGRPRVDRIGKKVRVPRGGRSEEHTSELQSLMRSSYAVFCLKKQHTQQQA